MNTLPVPYIHRQVPEAFSLTLTLRVGPIICYYPCSIHKVFNADRIVFERVFGEMNVEANKLFMTCKNKSWLTSGTTAYRQFRPERQLSTREINQTILFFHKYGWKIVSAYLPQRD